MSDKPKKDHAPDGSELAENPWWWALRHAYGIPDLISDDHALSYLAQLLDGGEEISSFEAKTDLAAITIGLVVDLGEEGSLDIVILNPRVNVGDLCVNAAFVHLNTQQAQLVASNQAPALVNRLCDFVRAAAKTVGTLGA